MNMSTLLSESDFEDVWKVIQWAALEGRICTVVAKDAPAKHLDHHRSKVHLLHALSSATREGNGEGLNVRT